MTTIGRFVKRPVAIEAVRFPEDAASAQVMGICAWMNECGYPWLKEGAAADKGIYRDPADGHLVIRTLEGDMKVSPGDWIIKGVRAELYPCKPDVFETTYAPVDDAAAVAADGYTEPPGFGVALCVSERLEMIRGARP